MELRTRTGALLKRVRLGGLVPEKEHAGQLLHLSRLESVFCGASGAQATMGRAPNSDNLYETVRSPCALNAAGELLSVASVFHLHSMA